MIDDFGGLLSEVCKFCGDNIYCVTDPRVPEEDLVKEQNIFVSHFAYACKTEGKNGISCLIYTLCIKMSDFYSGIF